MCRNIKTLYNFEPVATDAEIRAASLQFVRKISGFNKPSKTNEAVFFSAIDEIAEASKRLLARLRLLPPPEIVRRRPRKRRLARQNDLAFEGVA